MKKILSELIKFKTYEGNADKAKEVSRLYDYVLSLIPAQYHKKKFSYNGRESLIIYSKSMTRPRIVLQAHIDVVPGEDRLFSPRAVGNKIYGRGASDMKFAVASYIKTLQEIAGADLDFAVWLTSDEEIGGFDGVSSLLAKARLSCKFCFLPDGGNNLHYITRAKGVMFFKLTTSGTAAHGSVPWKGKNAIERLYKVYSEIKNSKYFNKTNKEHWHNTINLGKVEGGRAPNSVPDKVTALVDIRLTDNQLFERTIRFIKSICEKYDTRFEEIVRGSAFSLDPKNAYTQAFLRSLKESGIRVVPGQDHGSSDARFFSDKKIPVFMTKPICGGDHSEKEWVDFRSLEQFQKGLKDFLIKSGG